MPKVKAKKTTRPSVKSVRPAAKAYSVSPKAPAQQRAQKVTQKIGEKLKEPKVFVPIIIVVVLILLFVFKSIFVVAIVNGQPISRSAFNRQLEAQAGKQVMNALVTEKLVEEEAANRHISVSQSELDAQVKTIQNQLAKQGQTLDTALAAQGMTRDDFMTQLKLQTLVKKMLGSKIQVTDKEINDYITQNKDSLPTGLSDDQLKSQVKAQLEQQKLSQQAQLLVQQLQQKAKITYFINL